MEDSHTLGFDLHSRSIEEADVVLSPESRVEVFHYLVFLEFHGVHDLLSYGLCQYNHGVLFFFAPF